MKKIVLFLIIDIFVLITIICTLFFNVQIKERKREIWEIRYNYYIQNDILRTGGDYSNKFGHMPYYEQMERYLQLDLCAYHYYTGKVVSLMDVKTFLDNPLNPDGSPRTYVDDETGIIRDLVIWCSRHRSDIDRYHYDLRSVLRAYIVSHPEIGFVTLTDLSLDQLHMLERSMEDQDFEFNLGTVIIIREFTYEKKEELIHFCLEV